MLKLYILHCFFNVMNGRSKTQVGTKTAKHCSMYPICREVDIEITADNDMTIAIIVNQSLYDKIILDNKK